MKKLNQKPGSMAFPQSRPCSVVRCCHVYNTVLLFVLQRNSSAGSSFIISGSGSSTWPWSLWQYLSYRHSLSQRVTRSSFSLSGVKAPYSHQLQGKHATWKVSPACLTLVYWAVINLV